MFSAYFKVSLKRSRLYRCLHVSTRHFSTPFDKLRNTQGFSSYPACWGSTRPTSKAWKHAKRIAFLPQLSHENGWNSILSKIMEVWWRLAWMRTFSTRWQKNWRCPVIWRRPWILEHGWLQCVSFFGLDLSNRFARCWRAASPLPWMVCSERIKKKNYDIWIQMDSHFSNMLEWKKTEDTSHGFFGAHNFSIELHELESSYIELHDTLAPSDWTLEFTIGQGGLWLPHQLFNLMGSQEMCVFQANNLLETMLQCLCSMLHSKWSIKNIWQCASHQKKMGVPGSAAETSDEMRSDRMNSVPFRSVLSCS